jgi:cytochrome c oxidase cbb3-type subunit IV
MSALWPTLSGILTGILILLFALIFAWAWSGRRKTAFDATSRLPLEEDTTAAGGGAGSGCGCGCGTARRERAP